MNIQHVISRKRDRYSHTKEEITWLISAMLRGQVTDYQLAAWLMAAYINGLNADETAWLTTEIAHSGQKLDLRDLPKPWVDKHSTGGVGDKTTLIVLPVLAACGITIVKMSGRGLGITGGTIDKLSAVPGFRTDLSAEEMLVQSKKVGIALTGQTPSLAPADKILYALRDATATISSIPQIVTSVLGKKMAASAETIVLDVKCGSGAFMPNYEEASKLADALLDTAERCKLNVRVAVTDMEQPLGKMIGNALEIKEVADVLKGDSEGRLVELCLGLAAITLHASGSVSSFELGKQRAHEALVSGHALQKAQAWFEAQGAPRDFFECPDRYLIEAPVNLLVSYEGEPGWIEKWDAYTVGEAVLDLGGGRRRKEDPIDPSVGVESFIEVGSRVERGSPLFTVHAENQKAAEAAADFLRKGIEVSFSPISSVPVFLRM